MRSSICLFISLNMSKGDESKRNITDAETPVLEDDALEEKLKNMKLDLAELDNGYFYFRLTIIQDFYFRNSCSRTPRRFRKF
jgi:hypothetical protein